MKTIEIKVTARDISRGERGLCGLCPVALAVNRALKLRRRENGAMVLGSGAIRVPGHRTTRPIAAVRGFVCLFDGGVDVAPFSFDLALERES